MAFAEERNSRIEAGFDRIIADYSCIDADYTTIGLAYIYTAAIYCYSTESYSSTAYIHYNGLNRFFLFKEEYYTPHIINSIRRINNKRVLFKMITSKINEWKKPFIFF
jgi:hypothetical protein